MQVKDIDVESCKSVYICTKKSSKISGGTSPEIAKRGSATEDQANDVGDSQLRGRLLGNQVFGGNVVSKSLIGPERLTHCRSQCSSYSPTTDIRALVRLSGGAGTPQQLVSEPWLGSVGEREWDPSEDQASDVGDSHLRGRLLGNQVVSDYVPHRLEMEETFDIWTFKVLGGDMVSKSLIGSGRLTHCRSRCSSNSPTTTSTMKEKSMGCLEATNSITGCET
ncbi:hypothetical protein MTR_4g115430 [Medicago truncatula]|uniref:Uncharacterized protein n=1 Tax=Medicago truncatula TaxID=3880 RepID=G7JFD4_MEDTR|nr:hypothetical protein MTR_4g115430 [Medicago truncatula]